MASGKRKLIEEGKAELERLLEERIDEEGMTLDEIEAVVEKTMREVAAWVEERLVEQQRPPESNLAPCPRCRQLGSYKRILETSVLTIHGPRPLRGRRYHYCGTCGQGFSPFDTALGLEPGREATRQVRAWQAKYGSDGAFPAAAELLLDLRGLSISASTVERTTLEVGEQLRLAKASAPAAETPAPRRRLLPRTYLSMDGTMLPLRDPWKRDGTASFTAAMGRRKSGSCFRRTNRRDSIRASCSGSASVPWATCPA